MIGTTQTVIAIAEGGIVRLRYAGIGRESGGMLVISDAEASFV